MDAADLEHELEQLHPASFGWAMACCSRRRDDAEDVLQTTYMKILEGKAKFNGASSFKTWLFGVIRRTAAEHRRWRFLRERRMPPVPSSIQASAADELESAQENARLVAALQSLARRQREMLELVFYHDLTIEEASRTLGVSLGTGRVHYERGKKNLSRILRSGHE